MGSNGSGQHGECNKIIGEIIVPSYAVFEIRRGCMMG